MPEPEISIVTVNRNNAEGLQRTVDSVGAQFPVAGVQHVVVDGNSTDGSQAVVSGYLGRHPGVVSLSEPDEGIYDAMNKGIQLSSGRYVLFLNSGDTFAGGSPLRDLLGHLRDFSGPLALASVVHLNGGSKQDIVDPAGFSRWRMWKGSQPYNHQGALFRRDLLLALGGYDSSTGLFADAELMLKLLALGPTLTIPVTLSVYEGGGASSTAVLASPLHFNELRIRLLGLTGAARAASEGFAILQLIRRRGLVEAARIARAYRTEARRGA